MRGGRIKLPLTISGPSAVRQLNAIKMLYDWSGYDGPIMNASLVAL